MEVNSRLELDAPSGESLAEPPARPLTVAILTDCGLGSDLLKALHPQSFLQVRQYTIGRPVHDSAALLESAPTQRLSIGETAPPAHQRLDAKEAVTPELLDALLRSRDVVICALGSLSSKVAYELNEAALAPGTATCLFVAAPGDCVTVGPAIYRGAAPCLRCAEGTGHAAQRHPAGADLECSRPQLAVAAPAQRLAAALATAAILNELVRVAALGAPGLVGQRIRCFPDGSTRADGFGALPGCLACGRDRLGGARVPAELVWPERWDFPSSFVDEDKGPLFFQAREQEAFWARKLVERNAAGMSHGGGTLLAHLCGTARILRAWGQPSWLQRAGLYHSVYGANAMEGALFPPWERTLVRDIIGNAAEQFVYLFCTLHGGQLWRSLLKSEYIPPQGVPVENWRTGQQARLPAHFIAPLLVLLLAHELEQSQGPEGGPGEWLELATRTARLVSSAGWRLPSTLRDLTVSGEDERAARRLYLTVTSRIDKNSAAVTEDLHRIIALMPAVGEPHLLLGRVMLESGNEQGTALINKGLLLLNAWGTSWDKRASLEQWLCCQVATGSADPAGGKAQALVFDPLVGITGREAEKLFAPISTATFLAEYWGKKPLFVQGEPDRYRRLFSRERFFEALERGRSLLSNESQPGSFHIRASFDKLPTRPTVYIRPEQVRALFQCEATICVNAISKADPVLATFATAVKAQLGYPGMVRFNCYYSPDGCGFFRHFDARVAATLQIQGTKRWRFSRIPAMPWPRRNGRVTHEGLETFLDTADDAEDWEIIERIPEDQYEEVELRPGDLLVLPAGCWHACSAGGSSLALNLAFEPQGFSDILMGGLSDTFGSEVDWRSTPALDAKTNQIADQIQAAVRTLDQWKEDPFALRKSWARFVMNMHARSLSPPVPRLPARQVEPAHTLRLTRRLPVRSEAGKEPDGQQVLVVWVGPTEIELSGDEERALGSGILTHKEFRALDCVKWPGVKSWESAKEILEQLLQLGLLDVVQSGFDLT